MKNNYLKKFFKSFFIIFALFLCFSRVYAEDKKVTYRGVDYEYNDEYEAVYCGYKQGFFFNFLGVLQEDLDGCAKVSKKNIVEKTDTPNIVEFKTNFFASKLTGEKNIQAYVTTSKEDTVYKEPDKWWRTIQICYSNSMDHGSLEMYPDALSADIKQYSSLINSGNCATMSVYGVKSENKVSSCPKLIEKYAMIELYEQEYQKNNSPTYINKYKEELEEIKGLCMEVLKFSDWNEACTDTCLNLSENIHAWNNSFDVSDKTECGFSARLIAWIINIIKWIKYIIPVAVIVLGMLDFIKATGSDKDDEMKKAQGRFVKRLIAAALIFLVPLIIEFVLPKLGFDYNSCGLF